MGPTQRRGYGTGHWVIGIQFSSVQSLSPVRFFVTPWPTARQASLSITNSRSLLRLLSIESVMPSSHLSLCVPFSSRLQSFPVTCSGDVWRTGERCANPERDYRHLAVSLPLHLQGRPLLAAPDSTLGLLTHSLALPGCADLGPLPASVSSSTECDQNTTFPGRLCSMRWVTQSPWLHSWSWQALERVSCLFCAFSQCSQEAQKARSSDREHRIQKGSLWGGLRLFIKQANTFPPRKF